jgi:DNA-directed RNA polymerase subunit alpha
MPRIPFQKPKKVEWEILSERYGRLVSEPFEKGYALTVGNSLRRTLLAIVPGAAVTWAKIDGVRTADTPIPGVKESTGDVLLNVKRLAVQVPSGEPRTVRLQVSGPRTVTGADVPETELEIMNPEVHLFTLEGNGSVSIELGIGIGRGYESSERKTDVPAGAIALDSAFSPITKVSYNVEMSRLGKITDYEKLVVEIWTNGAVSPEEALERSATFLREHFTPLRSAPPDDEADADADGAYLRDALGKSLEELELAARAVNALKAADITLVADLAQKTEADLADVKNLGEKTIDEIKAALAGLGLSLGMRIDPNVLGALGRGAAAK